MTKTVIDLKNPVNKYFVDEAGKQIKNPPKLGSYKCSIILCMLEAAQRESFSHMLQGQFEQFQDKGERVDEIHVLSPIALPRLFENQATKSLENLIFVFSGKYDALDQDILPPLKNMEKQYPTSSIMLLSQHPLSRFQYMSSDIRAVVASSSGPGSLFYTSILPAMQEIYQKIKAPLRSSDPRAQAILDHCAAA